MCLNLAKESGNGKLKTYTYCQFVSSYSDLLCLQRISVRHSLATKSLSNVLQLHLQCRPKTVSNTEQLCERPVIKA